uniref:Reverse transcriptase n=1 Tax=Eptatretus burgeri TaxID=7764 RepID=A0A8C4N498_EPTBU
MKLVHFANIFTVVNKILTTDTGNFTVKELRTVIKSMANNKASGIDGIQPEFWISGSLNEQLLKICNKALTGDKPTQWSKSPIILFPKKWVLCVAKNYCGISLTFISAKIFNKFLLHRIRPHIEPIPRNK